MKITPEDLGDLLNQSNIFATVGDILLVWIDYTTTTETVFGFKDFEFWTDATRHMELVEKQPEYKNCAFYFYIPQHRPSIMMIKESRVQHKPSRNKTETGVAYLLLLASTDEIEECRLT